MSSIIKCQWMMVGLGNYEDDKTVCFLPHSFPTVECVQQMNARHARASYICLANGKKYNME